MYSIYRHRDPRDQSIRYVGLSKNPFKRFASHVLNANKAESAKDQWIEGLIEKGLLPILEIIESDIATIEEARKREIYWMQRYHDEGHPLTNAQVPYIQPRPVKPVAERHPLAFEIKSAQDTKNRWRIKGIAQDMGAKWVEKYLSGPGITTVCYVYQHSEGQKNRLVAVPMGELVLLSDHDVQGRIQELLNESRSEGKSKGNVTPGKLPEGYEIVPPPGVYARWFVKFNGQNLTTPAGNDKYFLDEFNATLFCWKHYDRREVMR